MPDNDRWRNDQGRDRYRSRDDQHGRAEGRYEDFGGRPDQGRFTGEGGGSRGGESRYAEQGRYEDFGGRADRGRFTGGGGGSRGGTEGYGYGGGSRGDYGRGEDRGSGRGQQGGSGIGGDYYSGFYGADQDYGRGRGEDRGQGYGGSSGYARGGDQRGYMDTPQGGEWRRYADRGGGREEYGGERGFFERVSDQVASWFGSDDPGRGRDQGGYGAQHHRGRGPRGYSRSDERIREDVNDRLTDDPYVDASDIEVSVSSREVTLSGTVDSREARRRAEDIAESVGGVTHVQNNLRVQRQGTSGGMSGGGTSSGGVIGGSSTTSSTAGGSGTTGLTGTGTSGTSGGTQGTASQGVTTPPMGESITGMNSSDANRIAQDTFGSTGDTTGTESRRS